MESLIAVAAALAADDQEETLRQLRLGLAELRAQAAGLERKLREKEAELEAEETGCAARPGGCPP